eukprot:66371_1
MKLKTVAIISMVWLGSLIWTIVMAISENYIPILIWITITMITSLPFGRKRYLDATFMTEAMSQIIWAPFGTDMNTFYNNKEDKNRLKQLCGVNADNAPVTALVLETLTLWLVQQRVRSIRIAISGGLHALPIDVADIIIQNISPLPSMPATYNDIQETMNRVL